MEMSLATMADLPRIMALVELAKSYMHQQNNYQWDAEYPLEDAFRKDIEDQDLYVYREKGILQSFICINEDIPKEYLPLNWKTKQPCLVIHRMVTNRELMGQGLALKMMQFAIDKAKDEGFLSVWTDTNSMNKGALHLFEKLKFHFVGNIILRDKTDLFCCYERAL